MPRPDYAFTGQNIRPDKAKVLVPNNRDELGPFVLTKDKATLLWQVARKDGAANPPKLEGQFTDLISARKACLKHLASNPE